MLIVKSITNEKFFDEFCGKRFDCFGYRLFEGTPKKAIIDFVINQQLDKSSPRHVFLTTEKDNPMAYCEISMLSGDIGVETLKGWQVYILKASTVNYVFMVHSAAKDFPNCKYNVKIYRQRND